METITIIFDYLEMKNENGKLFSVEHWRVVSGTEVVQLKVVSDYENAPFFMYGESYLPQHLHLEFESMCTDPLLYKKQNHVRRFVENIKQYAI